MNFAVGVLHLATPTIDPDTAPGTSLIRIIFLIGAALVFVAALVRTWATAYLRTEIVHDMSQHAEALVASGPYRYVRNPLYFANLPMVAGVGCMASRTGWAFMVLATCVFGYRLIFREEAGLRETQGPSYLAYLSVVPRLWPSLRPRVASHGDKPRWGQAFAGESMFWIFGLGVLCFAVTLNMKIPGIMFASAFPVYFTAVYFVKKRAGA